MKPRTRAKKTSNNNLPSLTAEYQGRQVALPRTINYNATILSIRSAFKTLRFTSTGEIMVYSRFKELGDDPIHITDEVWADVALILTHVTIILERDALPARPQLALEAPPTAQVGGAIEPLQASPDKFIIFVWIAEKKIAFRVSPRTSFQKIQDALEAQEGICPNDYRLWYGMERVSTSETVGDYGMQQGDVLDMWRIQVGGKPVIYLFPPRHQSNIHVHLSLVDSWSFSALYPPTIIKPGSTTNPRLTQSVSWTVDANPDGTLLDKGTGREVSYLFWEAHTVLDLPLTPDSSRPGSPSGLSAVTFDPLKARLEPNNSALLPLDKVTAYIDDALLALGLHTEARTSFITYWLPNLLAHKFIALRFVPQDEYETAARMTISPAPDIITRVFMIFQGVDEADLERWGPAQVRGSQSPNVWREVVGVDVEKAADVSMFRVLEWGGMEVK